MKLSSERYIRRVSAERYIEQLGATVYPITLVKFLFAAGPGLEPGLSASKAPVLPLDDPANFNNPQF